MHKKADEHIWLHFFCFFWSLSFYLWSPLGNYEKKSCFSSDLSARFKRPRKNKLMLRVSLKLLKNWRNGSQMCSSAFLCISPFITKNENERRNKLNFFCRNLSPGHQNKNLVKFEKIRSTYPILPRYVIKRWTFQVSYMPCLHIRAWSCETSTKHHQRSPRS